MPANFQKPKIKAVESLKKKKTREETGKFIIEGPHLIEEAFKAGRLDYILYAHNADKALVREIQKRHVANFEVARQVIDFVSEVKTPQGVIGVAIEKKFKLDDVIAHDSSLVVFCCEISDPGNFGTIIRAADAVAASGVVYSKGTVEPYNPKVLRSTMGSIFHLPLIKVESATAAISKLKNKGFKVIATDVKAERDHFTADYKGPLIILVGNEAHGLPKNLLELADEKVRIPMPGKAESLNVAMATSIVLYEALRQRGVHVR